VQTKPRPELKAPVARFHDKLLTHEGTVPLTDLAELFGAGDDVVESVRGRGDIRFQGDVFFNDGPDLVIPAGRIELEIPSLLRGRWTVDDDGFALAFPTAEFAVRACAQIAVFRKCFDLNEIRATAGELVLDFGGSMADRRYTF